MDLMMTKQQLRLYFVLPLVFSYAGALLRCWPLFALAAVTLFVLTGALPACAGRESLWLFLGVFEVAVPVNVFLIRCVTDSWWASGLVSTKLDGALWIALLFLTLLSMEELALLCVSRWIWPRQDEDEAMKKWLDAGQTKR